MKIIHGRWITQIPSNRILLSTPILRFVQIVTPINLILLADEIGADCHKTPPMSEDTAVRRVIVRPVSFQDGSESVPRAHNGWHEPLLDLYSRPITFPPTVPKIPKLYLVPTPDYLEGEELDVDSGRKPSPLSELPDLEEWVGIFVVSVVEAYGGKRPVQQLAKWSHRIVYCGLLKDAGTWKPLPKIRKLYISQPLDGIAEVTATLKFDQRVRSLVMRFEGVDKRWLCTKLDLL